MRRLIWPVLFLFLLVIQGAVTVFYQGWLSFDLLLVGLYAFTLIYEEYWGALAGLGIGLCQDALTMGLFGFHLLTRTALAYGVGKINKQINEDQLKYHLGMMFAGTLLIQIFYSLLEMFLSGSGMGLLLYLGWQAVGQAVGNCLLVLPMIFLFRIIQGWVTSMDITYALDAKHESAKRNN